MKFESAHKLIAGFSSISFTTVILMVSAFIFIMVQSVHKPSDDKSIAVNKIDTVKKYFVPKQLPVEQPKNEIAVKEEVSEPKVDMNSIVKKIAESNPNVEFDLDFGGRGIRKIKSYLVPEFDESEKGAIGSKLNFTIKPDGSVSKIYPASKTNTRLELNSIFAMRQWRFEPLKKSAEQIDQPAEITFLYHRK